MSEDIRLIVTEKMEKAASILGSALEHYFPVYDKDLKLKNALLERNATLAIAQAFSMPENEKWVSYGEVPCHKDPSKKSRIDLVLYNPSTPVTILVESKRLYSSEKATALANDFKKMNNFTLRQDSAHDKIRNAPQYCMMVALTHFENWANWWTSEFGENTNRHNDLSDILKIALPEGRRHLLVREAAPLPTWLLWSLHKKPTQVTSNNS